MPIRIIQSRIDKPFSSLPWSHAKVVFSLIGSTYDAVRQIPSFTQVVKADIAGNLEVALETTTDKENECYWQVTLPDGESFRFSVPTGTGDLQLSFLRQSGEIEPSTPAYNAITAYVDAAIESHNTDVNAHPALVGGGGTQFEFEVSQPVQIGSPVHLQNGVFVLANAALPGLSKIDGFALIASSIGSTTQAIPTGVIERSSWLSIAGTQQLSVGDYYLNPAIPGGLTNVPPQSGYLVKVGKAISPTKLFARPLEPIRL